MYICAAYEMRRVVTIRLFVDSLLTTYYLFGCCFEVALFLVLSVLSVCSVWVFSPSGWVKRLCVFALVLVLSVCSVLKGQKAGSKGYDIRYISVLNYIRISLDIRISSGIGTIYISGCL